jgi:DNA repair protein RecO (recombination protein O)
MAVSSADSGSHKQSLQPIFILHTYPFKETSLVVEMFSRDLGRIAAVAKGARRPLSAMRGMLQSFQQLAGTWSGKNELKTLHGLEWMTGLTLLKGDALMCGFYMNELLLRLLPRDDAHTQLFEYYAQTIQILSSLEHETSSGQLAEIMRRFELKMLQELGYAVPLTADENGEVIHADETYRFEADYGACAPAVTKNGVLIQGRTLLDMARGHYSNATTQAQSKQLMRYLLQHYLGDKPLHTRQLLVDLQGF